MNKKKWMTLLIVLAVCVSLGGCNPVKQAEKNGAKLGKAMGIVTGKAIGSYEGITKGRADGWQAGKEAGLSAEDTTVKLADTLRETAVLEVLVASVKLSDIHSCEDDYKALYLLNGNSVFSVDLSYAVIDEREDGLYISIPQPEMNLVIDQTKIKQEAQYQKHKYSGDAEDGLDAYINSMKKLVQESEDNLSNYKSLMQSAKTAAKIQVEQLASSVALHQRKVYVSFMEEEENQE